MGSSNTQSMKIRARCLVIDCRGPYEVVEWSEPAAVTPTWAHIMFNHQDVPAVNGITVDELKRVDMPADAAMATYETPAGEPVIRIQRL